MDQKFGIGRVPGDVDATGEAFAAIRAVEILAAMPRFRGDRERLIHPCACCGTPTRHLMCANSGRMVCPDCYDDEA